VAARRLRVLHPLSLVEDPTRIWRGARYAGALRLRPDAGFERALALALRWERIPPFPGSVSMPNTRSSWTRPSHGARVGLLLGWGAFRLWDASYRVTAHSRARLASARLFLRGARGARITVDSAELALLALLFDQSRPVADRCVRRLAVAGGAAARIDAGAAATWRDVSSRWARGDRVAWRKCSGRFGEGLAFGAWLAGGRVVRRHIEWFLREGRAGRPLSSGDDVVAAGVPRGPLVGQALAHLRDLSLDGRVRTIEEERAAVAEWMKGMATKGDLG